MRRFLSAVIVCRCGASGLTHVRTPGVFNPASACQRCRWRSAEKIPADRDNYAIGGRKNAAASKSSCAWSVGTKDCASGLEGSSREEV